MKNVEENRCKRRRKKHPVRFIAGLSIAAVLIVAAVLFFKNNSLNDRIFPNQSTLAPVDNESEPSDTLDDSDLDGSSDANESLDESDDENTKDNWALVLVNRWNPIQDDNRIEIMTLANGERIDKRIYPYLQEMFDDMRNAGVYPVVASGYRSEKEQEDIYNEQLAEYQNQGFSYDEAKSETEKWVAIPGTSEHQLGLAVDINADGINSAGYQVYDWLAENAYLYGFIQRYPESKTEITGVGKEPWHYRYVGVNAATEIYKKQICLEEYLETLN